MKSKPEINILFDENGKKASVLMSTKEFNKLMSDLEDLQDVRTVYQRTSKKLKLIPYEKIRKELFGNVTKK